MSSFRLGTAVRSMGIAYSSFCAHEMTKLSQTPCLCALYEPYPALAAVLASAFSLTTINDDLLPGKINGICQEAWARCVFYCTVHFVYTVFVGVSWGHSVAEIDLGVSKQKTMVRECD